MDIRCSSRAHLEKSYGIIEKLEKYGLTGKEKFIENNVTKQKK